MSLTYAGELLRRYLVLLLVAVLLGGLAGTAAAAQPQRWSTTTSLLVHPRTAGDQRQYLAKPERFIRSQIRIVTSDDVLEEALASEDVDASLHSFREDLEVDGGTKDDVIDVTVSGRDADASRRLAVAVAVAYIDATNARAQVLALDTERLGLSQARTVALGIGAGGALGLLLVLLLGAARRPVLSSRHLRVPPGAVVFPFHLPRRPPAAGQPDHYALLRSLLRNGGGGGPRRVLVAGTPASAAAAVESGLAAAVPDGRSDPGERSGGGLEVVRLDRTVTTPAEGGWGDAVLVCAVERGAPEAPLTRYVDALSPAVGATYVVVVEKSGWGPRWGRSGGRRGKGTATR